GGFVANVHRGFDAMKADLLETDFQSELASLARVAIPVVLILYVVSEIRPEQLPDNWHDINLAYKFAGFLIEDPKDIRSSDTSGFAKLGNMPLEGGAGFPRSDFDREIITGLETEPRLVRLEAPRLIAQTKGANDHSIAHRLHFRIWNFSL